MLPRGPEGELKQTAQKLGSAPETLFVERKKVVRRFARLLPSSLKRVATKKKTVTASPINQVLNVKNEE